MGQTKYIYIINQSHLFQTTQDCRRQALYELEASQPELERRYCPFQSISIPDCTLGGAAIILLQLAARCSCRRVSLLSDLLSGAVHAYAVHPSSETSSASSLRQYETTSQLACQHLMVTTPHTAWCQDRTSTTCWCCCKSSPQWLDHSTSQFLHSSSSRCRGPAHCRHKLQPRPQAPSLPLL